MSMERANFEPEIVVLYCQSTLACGADFAAAARRVRGFRVRPVVLPCTSKIEISHLFRILEQGADGIEILGCAGAGCDLTTVRIQKRLERARALLGHTKLGGRLWLDLGENLTAEQALTLAAGRALEVQALGRNPLRRESDR